MSSGMFIAGTIMAILAAASFQAGGMWIIAGIACLIAWICIAVYFYKTDELK